jgi:hypothetical protein
MLIIYQVKGESQTKDKKLRSYQKYLSKLVKEFDEIKFIRMGREKNQFVDALTTLASMTIINYENMVQPISIEVRNSLAHYCFIEGEVDGKLWYYDIKQLIQHHKYPLGASNTYMKTLRRLAMEYYLDVEALYKRSSDGTLLRCLDGIKEKRCSKKLVKRFVQLMLVDI